MMIFVITHYFNIDTTFFFFALFILDLASIIPLKQNIYFTYIASALYFNYVKVNFEFKVWRLFHINILLPIKIRF